MSKPTEHEITQEVKSAARYLGEKDLRDQLNQRPADNSRFGLNLKLIERDIADAVTRLAGILSEFEFGKLQSVEKQENHFHAAYEAASDALAELRIATIELNIEHPTRTRKLELQKSAARLAYSMFQPGDGRRVRDVAKRIMDHAGLGEPAAATVSRWLKEFRHEDSVNAQ